MKNITTLSQLGARLSIAKCHILKLNENKMDDNVNHVLYVVDDKNIRLQEYVRSLKKPFTVYDKRDNYWTPFNKLKKKGPLFGGDYNYDFLIRLPETKDIFLTLHDDSMLLSNKIWDDIRKILEKNHFGGYIDSRYFPGYDRVFLDKVAFSKLRIGTWFCFGRTDHYLKNNYTMGIYKNFPRWYLNIKYKTTRISSKGLKVWLNGGFNLNLKARLNNDHFHILDNNFEYAEHWEKITGFFSKRDMLKYTDSDIEVEKWEEYLRKLKLKNPKQFQFDLNFLDNLTTKIVENGIFDDLLNANQIERFRQL